MRYSLFDSTETDSATLQFYAEGEQVSSFIHLMGFSIVWSGLLKKKQPSHSETNSFLGLEFGAIFYNMDMTVCHVTKREFIWGNQK